MLVLKACHSVQAKKPQNYGCVSALVTITCAVISFSKTDFINTPLSTNFSKTRYVFFNGVGSGFMWISVCSGRHMWHGSAALVAGAWNLPFTWESRVFWKMRGFSSWQERKLVWSSAFCQELIWSFWVTSLGSWAVKPWYLHMPWHMGPILNNCGQERWI